MEKRKGDERGREGRRGERRGMEGRREREGWKGDEKGDEGRERKETRGGRIYKEDVLTSPGNKGLETPSWGEAEGGKGHRGREREGRQEI